MIKLTETQMRRLFSIRSGDDDLRVCPKTNVALRAKGLVDIREGKLFLTVDGKNVLAGFPEEIRR